MAKLATPMRVSEIIQYPSPGMISKLKNNPFSKIGTQTRTHLHCRMTALTTCCRAELNADLPHVLLKSGSDFTKFGEDTWPIDAQNCFYRAAMPEGKSRDQHIETCIITQGWEGGS